MALADRYDAFLFDLDGVLYRGDQPVPGAPRALRRLRERGKRVAFLTNNSGRTPEAVAAMLAALGIEAAPGEVVTSALATADVLAARGVHSAYVIGEEGVRRALADAGIEVRDGEPSVVDVVVVGWDRSVDYAKMRTAALLVQRGAALVATNDDAAYPAPDGLWPGAGALLAAITTTTGARPEVVGKPHPPLFLRALERAGGGRPLVVGDRLDTDVAGATALGWDSLLVLTGVTGEDELRRSAVRPTFVGRDLSVLEGEPPSDGAQRSQASGRGGKGAP
ncbi:MAG TPA: HAD-IIA family hydrolase [Actinomycetota bacterium]|nr:HAD-IIA family hydrolase [Actinomycetota bacterium]